MPPMSAFIRGKEEKTQVGMKQRNERRKVVKGKKRWRTHQPSITGAWAVGWRGRLSFSDHFWRKRRDTRRRGEFSASF